MSTFDGPASAFVTPRPGLVTTLGILNVVFSVLMMSCLLSSVVWIYGISRVGGLADIPVGTESGPGPSPMMGLNEPHFVRFSLVDAATAMVVNLAMLASGIGLLNRSRWGARLGAWTAGVKIVRLFLLWGYFIVMVAPALSERMGKDVAATIGRGPKAPTAGQLTEFYNYANLFVGVSVIVLGSIYPALSLWFLSRPGVKAVFDAPPIPLEPKLS